jgi:MFS family permease
MVGVLSALRVLAITLPQLWAASVLVARPFKRPLLIWSSIGGRLPILVLAIATALWTATYRWLVIGVLGLAVAAFYTSEGLNGVSWPALVGKVIPSEIRGRFFGFGQFLSSFGALGAGYVVRALLGQGGASDPTRWAALFACGFVCLMLSVASMLFIREEADETLAPRVDLGHSGRAVVGFLRTQSWLRRLVAAQLVLGAAAATFPFFVVRARELVAGGDQVIGLFLVVQNLGGVTAALVCGQLIDRIGSWLALRVVAVAQVAALSAAILASTLGAVQAFYIGAFALLGFVGGSSWWSFSAYLLDMAGDEQRPIYLAASGVLTSPLFLSSILVGGLFEWVAGEVVFAAALGLSVAGASLAWAIPRAGVRSKIAKKAAQA